MRSDFFYSKLKNFVIDLAALSGGHNPAEFLDELMQQANTYGGEFALDVMADLYHLIQEHSEYFWSDRHREEITEWFNNSDITMAHHRINGEVPLTSAGSVLVPYLPSGIIDEPLFTKQHDPSIYATNNRNLKDSYSYSQYAKALQLRNISISKKGVGVDNNVNYIEKFGLKPGETLYNKWNALINGKIQDTEDLEKKALEIIKNKDL
jgi:hypothetical protein